MFNKVRILRWKVSGGKIGASCNRGKLRNNDKYATRKSRSTKPKFEAGAGAWEDDQPQTKLNESMQLLELDRISHHQLEVHRLSADNRYRPYDNRHRLIIGIGRLFVLVSKTTKKMLLTAVHIDDNEVTNDSVISHVSSSTFNRTK